MRYFQLGLREKRDFQYQKILFLYKAAALILLKLWKGIIF